MFSRHLTHFFCTLLVLTHDVCLAIGPTPSTAARPLAGETPAVPSSLPPEFNYYLGTLGFGGIAGWSVGFTLKKVAKLAALVLGVVIIAVQALSYNHFIAQIFIFKISVEVYLLQSVSVFA